MINIVLVEPRIPQNTGNIGRLCLACNARLHLIYPLGFVLNSRELKRAGMDYFEKIELLKWDNLESFLRANPISNSHFLLSTKARRTHFEAKFCDECFLYFGREDAGLPKNLLQKYPQNSFKIPMFNSARSLNLANSVAIVAYEALRQITFQDRN